ncbi:coil containing protein [Vibrio phage 1.031.O._10N.261.46.F8]|nr:coil containing protein [Vibrio phage 1.031.O._10N.261.46.F8]
MNDCDLLGKLLHGSMTSKQVRCSRHYMELITSRRDNPTEPKRGLGAWHHILPRSLFPEYDDWECCKWNWVYLTHKEHFVAHHLLYEIYDRKGSMAQAFHRMIYGSTTRGTKYNIAQIKNWRVTRPGPKSDNWRASRSRTVAGEGNPNFGLSMSQEQKDKISHTLKGKMAGELHPMYGKSHSEETKQKISAAISGRVLSDVTRQRMSVARRGEKRSEETKARMAQAQRDRTILVVECPHCGVSRKTWRASMKNKHFDNCDKKNIKLTEEYPSNV